MMPFDRPWVALGAGFYLLVVLLIGIWAAWRTHSAKDFFIAGQRLGVVVTGIATMSAAFSGFVFIGGPGLSYRLGLVALMIAMPASFTAALLTWVLGKRLRLLAEVRDLLTVPDAILARYRSRLASGLAAIAIVFGAVGYLGVQLLALGVTIEAVFGAASLVPGASLALAMAGGLAVVLFYSVAGGMVAGVYTDLFQGALMILTAVAVFASALRAPGGATEIVASIVASERFGPAFLDPLGEHGVLLAFGFFFVFGVGTLGQPHMLHKFYMLKNPRDLKWMPLIVGGSQALCILLWVGVGLAVPALVAQGRMAALENPDLASPHFLLHFVPQIVAGLALAGVLAAIMSTVDSFVNIGAAALVRDLPRAFGYSSQRELLWGRIATVGLALSAAGLAWAFSDLIALFGVMAFGTFAAALVPALAVGLNWDRVTPSAASASIATGLVLNLSLEFLARQSAIPWLPRPPLAAGALPSAVSLAASFSVLFLVTWVTGRRGADRLDDDVRAVMEI